MFVPSDCWSGISDLEKFHSFKRKHHILCSRKFALLLQLVFGWTSKILQCFWEQQKTQQLTVGVKEANRQWRGNIDLRLSECSFEFGNS